MIPRQANAILCVVPLAELAAVVVPNVGEDPEIVGIESKTGERVGLIVGSPGTGTGTSTEGRNPNVGSSATVGSDVGATVGKVVGWIAT